MSKDESNGDINAPLLMWIEDVFVVRGNGTTVTGYVQRGTLKFHDYVEVVGLQQTRRTCATDIEQDHRKTEKIVGGKQAGILLRGLYRDYAEIGQVLAAPGSIQAYTEFEGDVRLLSEAGESIQGVFNGKEAEFFFRTIHIFGMYTSAVSIKETTHGTTLRLTCKLRRCVALEIGMEFGVLIRGKVVGSGIVANLPT